MTRTMCDILLLNSVATNYPTTYKGESVTKILEILFTEHEAQLKAKDEEIERLKAQLNSMHDLMYRSGYSDAMCVVDKIFNDHEEQLKAKDECIKELECRTYHAEGYINDLHNSPKVKKFYDKKARSIVAMMFWEWRKEADDFGRNQACICFEKAYKMLKDNQC